MEEDLYPVKEVFKGYPEVKKEKNKEENLGSQRL